MSKPSFHQAASYLLLQLEKKGVPTNNTLIVNKVEPVILREKYKKILTDQTDAEMLIHYHKDDHSGLIVYRHFEGKDYFLLFDSIASYLYGRLLDPLRAAASELGVTDTTIPLIVKENRQRDMKTCIVFMYKDLKLILKNPDITKQIIDDSKKDRDGEFVTIETKKLSKVNSLIMRAEFFKYTQLTKKPHELKKIPSYCDKFNLWEYLTDEITKCGVTTSQYSENGTLLNHRAALSLSKYIGELMESKSKDNLQESPASHDVGIAGDEDGNVLFTV